MPQQCIEIHPQKKMKDCLLTRYFILDHHQDKYQPLENASVLSSGFENFLLIQGIGGPGWGKYIFFILTYVIGLPLSFPKWAHLHLNSNHCEIYGRKGNDD